MQDTTKSMSSLPKLRGVTLKITLLMVIPIVLVAMITVYAINATTATFYASAAQRLALDASNDKALNVKDQMLSITNAGNTLLTRLQGLLMEEEIELVGEVNSARDEFSKELDRFVSGLGILGSTLAKLGFLEVVDVAVPELSGAAGETGTPPTDAQKLRALRVSNTQSLTLLTGLGNKLKQLFALFVKSNDGTLHLAQQDNFEAAINNFVYEDQARSKATNDLVKKMSVVLTGLIEDINKTRYTLLDLQEQQREQALANNKIFVYLVLLLGALLIAVGAVFFASRQFASPLQRLAKIMRDTESNSDLTMRSDITANDEMGEMAYAFNAMLEKFEMLIQKVARSATQLSTDSAGVSAVTRVSTGNLDKQCMEINQVATAINQMTATVREVACSAQSAANAATDADKETRNGTEVVNKTTSAIEKLFQDVESATVVIHTVEEDCENIGSVLDVIKNIAEQTNLLALNAAIEAARAGEQGRGFAVVADEVRTLASRTQESTAEIEVMIDKLQSGSKHAVTVMDRGRHQTQQVTEMARDAGQSLEAIAAAVSIINDMNIQIASAAEQQSAVSEEINQNIINISQLSSETSGGVEHANNASADLAQLASFLHDLVSKFKVKQ